MEPKQTGSAALVDETSPRRLRFSLLGLAVGLLGLLFAIFQPHLVEAIDPPPPPTKLADTLAEAGDKFVGRMLDRVRPGKGAPVAPHIPVEPPRPLPLRWYLALLGPFFGLLGAVSGMTGWVKREDSRVTVAAMATGFLAVAWVYIVAALVIALIIGFLGIFFGGAGG